MTEFEDKAKIYEEGWRGTYLIIPLKVTDGKIFQNNNFIHVPFDEVTELSDKSDLLKRRCNSDYINKYVQGDYSEPFQLVILNNIKLSNLQLFIFENGIGFLTLFAFCHNKDINSIYQLVNNGYIGTQDHSDAYEVIYDAISEVINPLNLEIFVKDKTLLLNESYVHNVAFVSERFKDLETLDQITLNVHKQIALERRFSDKSEKDIWHTYGARDVDKETYRWGCCISTLDISFVYQNNVLIEETSIENISHEMLDASAGDLLLTILVLVQKYTCMKLNDDIHSEIYESINVSKTRKIKKKSIRELKKKALEFRAFGTLAPSQVSRWNNVCETYRGLLEVLGINEALTEIEQKIDLLNSEQEQQAADKQNIITFVITIFGLVSIIASVLTIVDLVSTGAETMLMWLIATMAVLVIFGLHWLIMYLKK